MIDNQRRGSGEALQRLPPECLILAKVLLLQPVDVVPVRSGQWRGYLLALAEGFVEPKHLGKNQCERPAFQNRMVNGPDEVELGLPMAQQRQAEQWRARQLESATAIRILKLCNTLVPIATRDSTPVLLVPGQFDLRMNFLARFSEIFPTKIRA